LHQIANVWAGPSIYLKLTSRKIIFEVFQHMWSLCLNVTDRQTDRRTDRRHTTA